MGTRILLADDHGIARAMIRRVIAKRTDWQIVEEASDGADAVAKAYETCPDLAILDIQMPVLSGIEAAKKILKCCPATVVMAESLHEGKFMQDTLKQAGVRGFVQKMEFATELIPAIEIVLKGGEWFKDREAPQIGEQLESD